MSNCNPISISPGDAKSGDEKKKQEEQRREYASTLVGTEILNQLNAFIGVNQGFSLSFHQRKDQRNEQLSQLNSLLSAAQQEYEKLLQELTKIEDQRKEKSREVNLFVGKTLQRIATLQSSIQSCELIIKQSQGPQDVGNKNAAQRELNVANEELPGLQRMLEGALKNYKLFDDDSTVRADVIRQKLKAAQGKKEEIEKQRKELWAINKLEQDESLKASNERKQEQFQTISKTLIKLLEKIDKYLKELREGLFKETEALLAELAIAQKEFADSKLDIKQIMQSHGKYMTTRQKLENIMTLKSKLTENQSRVTRVFRTIKNLIGVAGDVANNAKLKELISSGLEYNAFRERITKAPCAGEFYAIVKQFRGMDFSLNKDTVGFLTKIEGWLNDLSKQPAPSAASPAQPSEPLIFSIVAPPGGPIGVDATADTRVDAIDTRVDAAPAQKPLS